MKLHLFMSASLALALVSGPGCGTVKSDDSDAAIQIDAAPSVDGSVGECPGVDLQTDPENCGDCGVTCTEVQACDEGTCTNLTTLVTPEIATQWLDPTGWLDDNGTGIRMTFVAQDVPGALHECRTDHISMVGTASWGPCDGGDGTQPFHDPSPGTMDEGRYETQYRVKVGTWTSAPLAYRYYVHKSLNNAPRCPPAHTDAEVFAAAAATTLDDDNQQFLNTGLELANPFVKVPFRNITMDGSACGNSGGVWPCALSSYDVAPMSLRREFTMNGARTMLLVKRRYASRRAQRDDGRVDCRNSFKMRRPAQSAFSGDCTYMVFNARGAGVCIVENAGSGALEPFNGINPSAFIRLAKRSSFPFKRTTDCPACDPWVLTLPQ